MEEEDDVRPVWPEAEGTDKQRKQMHFDFQVDDVMKMVKKADELGATKSDVPFGGNDFVTLFDPAGHPFCPGQK